MDIFIIFAVALCGVVFAAIVKKTYREFAIMITVLTAVLVLVYVFEQSAPFITQIEGIVDSSVVNGIYISVLLKAVGITIIGQITSSICKDSGEQALAYTVDIASKIAVLIVSLPVITTIFEFISEILRM